MSKHNEKRSFALNTKLLPVTPESIAEAGGIIRGGGLVGFPTETVYGLGANALDGDAVRQIFRAKGRPGDNPLITHVASEAEIAPLIRGGISDQARALMRAYWPGPMTLIFPKSDRIPPEVSAGLDTVGIRMPSHPAARALIEAAGVPIAAPSANRSGRPSPTTARHVLDDMDGRIPLILDGGACAVGVESTVIDVTGRVPRVLRPGGVTPEMIAAAAGAVEVDGAVMRPLREGEKPRSPGMKYRHYAPEGALTIFEGEAAAVARAICARYDAAPDGAAILALPGHEALYGGRRVLPLGDKDSAESVAASLFAVLRALDDEGVKLIFSEAVDEAGVGLAVMNRLGRAAAFHIEKV
ncbi:MAG: threonylcarbamoyl-AMP synthase [Clostridia bacterium]|nr:threonylcarbamoyl-AMP synthase [Clostridia bacterium]